MNPKLMVAAFKKELTGVARALEVPPYKVNSAQYYTLRTPVLRHRDIHFLGGFSALKAYVAPAPGMKSQKSDLLKVLEKVKKNVA